jgi:uncharacterized protein YneF (UPF0154 family)
MELMLVALVGTLNVMCFIIGAKVGQKVSRDETIELPNLNPMKAIREMQDKKEAERVQDKIETIMQNIDNYDGTSAGQRDVRG